MRKPKGDMMKGQNTVDDYIEAAGLWREPLARLRAILCDTALEESIKWGAPCYSYAGKLVVGMAGFKAYFGLWFHQGVLLSDPDGVLVNAQKGKTQALRQWRMTGADDIQPDRIRAYVEEAISLARAGKGIKVQRGKPVIIPEELQVAFAHDPGLKTAFEALSLGRRRDFADHIASAKRPETRARRLEKAIPLIKDGIGLNDRYKKP